MSDINCTSRTFYGLENLSVEHMNEIVRALECADFTGNELSIRSKTIRNELICEIRTVLSMSGSFTHKR